MNKIFQLLLIGTGWLALMSGVFADDEKTDAELFDFARNREQHVRVTPDPFRIYSRVALQCKAPSPDQLKAEAANPHYRAAVLVFASDNAVEPLWDPYAKFPVGSILLKAKFDDRNLDQPTQFTGMIKRDAGYFPDCGDWEFFTLDGELTSVTSRGKLESCAKCHRDYAQHGYVSKEYSACPTHVTDALIDGLWQGRESIVAGSDHVIRLPASLAETLGPKLTRNEALQRWYQAHPAGAGAEANNPPEDLSELGGPTLRYEPDEKKNTLGYWTKVEDWASWNIDVRQAGTYDVSVLQGCGKDSGGAEVDIGIGDQSLTFVVEDTGHFQNFKWRDVGKIAIEKPGQYVLTVKPKSKPGVAVMDLRQIVLRPAALVEKR